MAVLDSRDVESCPQVVGDALVLAVAGGVDPARPLALRCLAVLRERGWPGDAELADQLSAVLDPAANCEAGLAPVPVDLDDDEERWRGRAREWLADSGYRAGNCYAPGGV